MNNLKYLKLLSDKYPDASSAEAGIIEFKAICGMPKGTEYFFSDLHGEHKAFIQMLRSASGVIREKIRETFGFVMADEAQLALAELIYHPKRQIEKAAISEKENYLQWQKKMITDLLAVTRIVQTKSSRRKVRRQLPEAYAHIIDELLHSEGDAPDKNVYYRNMLDSVLEVGSGDAIIVALCHLIRSLSIDTLHIIGDVYDRGPRADLIMDELMKWNDVDFQWGNHDVSWIGAASGNPACIATVLRIAIAYNCFDFLEDGYGINLRPLYDFAQRIYGNDHCEAFMPHLLDENRYDVVRPEHTAKMCKAITVILLKLEGTVIRRHPEYRMENRLFLDKIDYEKGSVLLNGIEYKMNDTSFPTVDPKAPFELTEEEQSLMSTLRASFLHSERLQRHIDYLFRHGSMYLVRDGNLMFHGCVPMDEDGSFSNIPVGDGCYSGKKLMDVLQERCIRAYQMKQTDPRKEEKSDLFWYLWCGADSPLFGKDKMATFESIFLDEKELKKEAYDPYYRYSPMEEYARIILREFGVDEERGHIINGHVPVKVRDGELPVKAGGKLIIIDGGMSKAYQRKTGIAGYTLIFNSHHIALAEHRPYREGEEETPRVLIVEVMKERLLIRDTDEGKRYEKRTEEIRALLDAYKNGLIK